MLPTRSPRPARTIARATTRRTRRPLRPVTANASARNAATPASTPPGQTRTSAITFWVELPSKHCWSLGSAAAPLCTSAQVGVLPMSTIALMSTAQAKARIRKPRTPSARRPPEARSDAGAGGTSPEGGAGGGAAAGGGVPGGTGGGESGWGPAPGGRGGGGPSIDCAQRAESDATGAGGESTAATDFVVVALQPLRVTSISAVPSRS